MNARKRWMVEGGAVVKERSLSFWIASSGSTKFSRIFYLQVHNNAFLQREHWERSYFSRTISFESSSHIIVKMGNRFKINFFIMHQRNPQKLDRLDDRWVL